LHAERRRLEALPTVVHPAQPLTAIDLTDTYVPWDTPSDNFHSQFLAALEVLIPSLPDQDSSRAERSPESSEHLDHKHIYDKGHDHM
jgi:hypothetical protein